MSSLEISARLDEAKRLYAERYRAVRDLESRSVALAELSGRSLTDDARYQAHLGQLYRIRGELYQQHDVCVDLALAIAGVPAVAGEALP